MKYYKDSNTNEVFAFENDGSQDSMIKSSYVRISESDAIAMNKVVETPDIITVSPWQIRKALNILGLRSAVESVVEQSHDVTVKDGWEFASEFREDNQLIKNIAPSLGIADEDIHSIFVLAKEQNG